MKHDMKRLMIEVPATVTKEELSDFLGTCQYALVNEKPVSVQKRGRDPARALYAVQGPESWRVPLATAIESKQGYQIYANPRMSPTGPVSFESCLPPEAEDYARRESRRKP